MGNPGPAYAFTRHNAGFILGDFLAREWQLPSFRRAGPARVTDGVVLQQQVAIVKPDTYMNRSGTALGPLLDVADFDFSTDLLVAVDDYALPLGSLRMRARGSAGGHNGLVSIENRLGSQEYCRLRIGVGPLPDGFDDPADFVLSGFEQDEVDTLARLLPTLADAVECWLTEGIETAMNRFNRRLET
ncbi:MAG: aminoacyl-tRNA hydrolase [Gemmatimonadota bacterium]|nr:MAG: aminoacyl-tRNA hydrolase [Gemmatimonadota bacterium]